MTAGVDDADTSLGSEIDFDLHGFLGVRLADASKSDVAAVSRQLGILAKALEREPDIVIRFVPRVRWRSHVSVSDLPDLGRQDAKATIHSFLVVGRQRRGEGRAMVPFGEIGAGSPWELICESGSGSVPLLRPIVNITALSKGFIPVHASAFSYRGTGVLVSGLARGGKTTTLLAFMADGADYIADDWVYLTHDGSRAYGSAEPIEFAHRHLESLPEFRMGLGWRGRVRLRAASLARLVGGFPSERIEHLSRGAEGRLSIRVDPRRLFGEAACTFEGDPRKVFLVVRNGAKDVHAEPIGLDELARRLAYSSRHERLGFNASYLKFCFASPSAANELIDRVDELEFRGLGEALKDKEAYVIHHPSSVPARTIYEAIRALL